MLKLGFNKDISDINYHGDDEYYSSSQLKVALNNIQEFHKKYITKEIVDGDRACFRTGRAYHERLLEITEEEFQEKYKTLPPDIKQRRGKKYEEFLEKNPDAIILGNKEMLDVDMLYSSTIDSQPAMEILKGGKSEVTFTAILEGMKIKVRWDKLNLAKGYGADPKSCDKMLVGTRAKKICQSKIATLDYDLSAALYIDVTNEFIKDWNAKHPKKQYPLIDTFYWIFASKAFPSCKVYKATKLMIENGRKKYKLAIEEIKKQEALGWVFKDEIEEIDPIAYDIIDKPEIEVESFL